MSDGGGESGRGDFERWRRRRSINRASSGDEFARAVSRAAVAQVCESIGFQGFQRSALEALSDVTIRYISDLLKTTLFYANLAGRTECNVFDVVQGLEDLSSSYGFPGAWDVDHCLVRSGIVREIKQYVNSNDEVPFARPIPRFPIARSANPIPSFEQVGENPPGKHIPSWLPALPDPHTYIQTPVWHDKVQDSKADLIEQVRQRRKAETSLLSLQQRLAGSDTALPVQTQQINAWKGKQVSSEEAELNPFLAPPLPFGEKEVSQLAIPKETAAPKTISVLETFAPAIEALKNRGLDAGEGDNKIIPTKRPTVHFKFGIGKKALIGPPSQHTKASLESASLLLRDDGRDDKKRRAKLILRESMENPQELHQL